MSRRGPKPKPQSQLRTNRISVYFTHDELKRFSNLAGGKSRLASYLRNAALNRFPKIIPEINRQAWVELSHTNGALAAIMLRVRNQDDWVEIVEIKHAIEQFRYALIGAKFNENEDH